jgi:hypothetical protein
LPLSLKRSLSLSLLKSSSAWNTLKNISTLKVYRQKYKKTKQPQMNENILFQYKIKIISAEIIVSKHLFNFQFFPSFCFCNRQAMAAAKFNMLVTFNLKN